MKYVKIIIAIAVLAFAGSAKAEESDPVSLGYYADAPSYFEVNLLTNYLANVRVYCNGSLVFQYDTGGVTYVASGVSYSGSYGAYTLSGLPAGTYTGTLDVVTGATSAYSVDNTNREISWVENWGWLYAYAYYWVY